MILYKENTKGIYNARKFGIVIVEKLQLLWYNLIAREKDGKFEYYKTLNVSESASREEIERAFKMSLRDIFSPLNQEDRYSQERFDSLMAAYLVLIDAEDCMFTNVRKGMKVELTEGNKKYLCFHRDNRFLT